MKGKIYGDYFFSRRCHMLELAHVNRSLDESKMFFRFRPCSCQGMTCSPKKVCPSVFMPAIENIISESLISHHYSWITVHSSISN